MDDVALEAIVRAVRTRRKLSQRQLAGMAGIAHATISLVERGHGSRLSLETIKRIAAALEIRVELTARWRGGNLDRLLSRRHSMLAESFARFLGSRPGWVVEPEVSFAIYGERGVVDQLAWHAGEAHVLIVELKTAFVDVNEMLGTLDRKRRLAATIAGTRGWKPKLVSVWLIVSDTHTNRRHARDHGVLLSARFPFNGRQLRSFLSKPETPTSGLAFWPSANPRSTGPNRSRDDMPSSARRMPSRARSSVVPLPLRGETRT
ncbi:MAG TPA: helix-turn-helix transcriptional regulator [Candidatus Limnocylindrales bacterium]